MRNNFTVLLAAAAFALLGCNQAEGPLSVTVNQKNQSLAAQVQGACPDGSSLVETVTVPSASVAGASTVASLANGQSYALVASGTYQSSQNAADAEYITKDGWATHADGYDIAPYFLGEGAFDLQVNGNFVNWGAYSPTHEYSLSYTGTGAPVSFRVFDGNSNTATIDPSWYGDNSGSLTVAVYACNAAPQGGPLTESLPASADTYVRKGGANTNEGASPILRLQAAGDNRALIRFDQNAIAAVVGNGTLVSVSLELEIEEAKNNWGKTGREIGAHRLVSDWAEGNGKNAELKANQSYRGDGVGATWNCAKDQNINNQKPDCVDEDDWEMRIKKNKPFEAPWIEQFSHSQFINKKQEGVVAFDVTADVAAFLNGTPNYGWVIRKGEENKAGYVTFHSRETGVTGPRLIITWLPAGVEPPPPPPAPETILDFVIFGAGDGANGNNTSIGSKVVANGLIGGNRKVTIRSGSNAVGIRSGYQTYVGSEGGGDDDDSPELGLLSGIIANDKVTIKAKANVLGTVDGSQLQLGTNARIGGNVVLAGLLSMNAQGTIDANADAGSTSFGGSTKVTGTLTLPIGVSPVGPGINQNSTILGALVNGEPKSPKTFAKIVLPAPLTFTPAPNAAGDVTVANGGTSTLAPGTYRDLDLKANATLNLSAGTYVFKTIKSASNATINFNATAGDVIILVGTGGVSFGTGLTTNVIGGTAANVYLETSDTFGTSANSVWNGTVFSTKSNSPGAAAISIGGSNTINGALYSNQQVSVTGNSTLTLTVSQAFSSRVAP